MQNPGLQRRLMQSGSLPPLLPSGPPGMKRTGRNNPSKHHDYSPTEWNAYFDKKEQLTISEKDSFNVYTKGEDGIVLFLLHGGGYSGLTWACFANRITELIDCRIIAPDLRGHGDTVTEDPYNLSEEQQVKDIENIAKKMLGEDSPPVFLMGHSMGGALAVHCGIHNVFQNLIGLTVIDVVEGSAMDALQSMQMFLRGRPTSFKSREQAIEWCLRSGQTRNVEAARISMPAQIRKCENAAAQSETVAGMSELKEEDETESGTSDLVAPPAERYEWRIDLSKSEPYWEGWFRGLSEAFLNIQVPKLLLLAGVDRLDKDLTVGQMRGQFQMIVLPKVGHAVQEDSPDRVADALATFIVRNKFATAKAEFKPVFPGC